MHLRNGVVLCLNGDPELLASRISRTAWSATPVQGGEGQSEIAANRRDDGGARQLHAERTSRQLLRGDDGSEGKPGSAHARVLTCPKRVAEDDTKQRLKNEPKPGDIKVTGA